MANLNPDDEHYQLHYLNKHGPIMFALQQMCARNTVLECLSVHTEIKMAERVSVRYAQIMLEGLVHEDLADIAASTPPDLEALWVAMLDDD